MRMIQSNFSWLVAKAPLPSLFIFRFTSFFSYSLTLSSSQLGNRLAIFANRSPDQFHFYALQGLPASHLKIVRASFHQKWKFSSTCLSLALSPLSIAPLITRFLFILIPQYCNRDSKRHYQCITCKYANIAQGMQSEQLSQQKSSNLVMPDSKMTIGSKNQCFISSITPLKRSLK